MLSDKKGFAGSKTLPFKETNTARVSGFVRNIRSNTDNGNHFLNHFHATLLLQANQPNIYNYI
jgi:hypothetical protein